MAAVSPGGNGEGIATRSRRISNRRPPSARRSVTPASAAAPAVLPYARSTASGAVIAAVVLSTFRGCGGGIDWRTGLPQPGSASSLPSRMTTLPRTMVSTGRPFTRRPCHGEILLLEKSDPWSIVFAAARSTTTRSASAPGWIAPLRG